MLKVIELFVLVCLSQSIICDDDQFFKCTYSYGNICVIDNYIKTTNKTNYTDIFKHKKKVTEMRFEGGNLHELPIDLFIHYRNVKTLSLYQCDYREIKQTCLENAYDLLSFESRYNKLKALSAFIFQHTSKLQYLFLSNNEIEYINPDAFFGLENLKYLDLSWNRLRSIKNDLFYILKNLDEINLSFNKIHELDYYNFNVKKIILNNNRLTSLNIKGSMIEIQACNNKITLLHIESDIIENLDLNNNSITDLRNISKLTSIKYLDVSYNNIDTNTYYNLNSLSELIELNLVDVQLCCLTDKTFNKLTKLEKLDIRQNDFKIYDLNILRPLNNLKELGISENVLSKFNLEQIKFVLPCLRAAWIYNMDDEFVSVNKYDPCIKK